MHSQVFDYVTPYLNWQYGKIALGIFVLLWVARFAIDRSDGLRTGFGSLLEPFIGTHKKVFEAKRAESGKDWSRAGHLYEQAGELEKAIDCFEKAEEYPMCGELCIRMGRKDYAAEWFLLAGDKRRAAGLFKETGQHDRAAEVLIEAGSSLDAASALLKSGQFTKAGEIFEVSGNYIKAGEAFERGKVFDRAAASFSRQVNELGGVEGRYVGARERAELTMLSRRAAKCFEQVGKLEDAVRILERGGLYAEAAEQSAKLEDFRRAAELYQRAGQVSEAAAMYERAGDAKTAASLEGDQQLTEGNAEAAAESFIKSGDPVRAAELFESIGQYVRASECYESVGAFAQAADASLRGDAKEKAAYYFESAKQLDRAAEILSELGDFEKACKLFAETGRFFDAAKAAAEANSEQLMLDYLQRVPPSDPNYLQAVVHLARIFTSRGWSSLAVEKLKAVLEGQALGTDNLDLWYVLAESYEAEGELAEAAELLHKVMAVQYNYRDAAERYSRIQTAISEQTMRAETLQSPKVSPPEGRYVVDKLLGKGGMGSVYKAYDQLLKRAVAYKVLSEQLARNPAARDQLLQEARAAAALNHPNVITIFDIGLDGEQAFICMELVEGQSYSHLLREKKQLSVPEAMHFLVSACQGLDHAHRKGIVHRDIKPSNILLTTDNGVKIVDFGLAQPIEDLESSTTGSSLSGTPQYLPPEQARGEVTDACSDIYALGATLYHLLVGHAVFTEGNLIHHHLYTPPPPLRKERPDIPAELEDLVLLCLAKQPAERYQSAGEIISFASAARLL